MAEKLYTEEYISDIADAIRRKNGKTVTYTVSEMAEAIDDITSYPEPTGTKSITQNGVTSVKDFEFADVNVQATATLISKTITQNGSYDAEDDEADGYSDVTVNVPNSYEASDEGKVVSNGELVAQTSTTVTQNGTYDTTLNDEVVVNVSGGGSAVVEPLSVTQNGTYTPPSGVDGYAPVTVNVSGGGGGIQTGTTPPTSDMGSDGDYYKQIFPLPSSVNFVDYLKSSGTQYIDTGLYAKNDTDVDLTYIHNSSDVGVFGARHGSFSSYTDSLFLNDTSSTASLRKGTTSGATERYNSNVSLSTNEVVHAKTYTIKYNNLYAYISTINGKLNTYSEQTRIFQEQNEIRLFGYGSPVGSKSATTILRAVFLEGNAPVADYIPCLDNNGVACMWDNIAQEYVYNDGTGDFLYGSAVTPTELEPTLWVKDNGSWRAIGS